MPSGVSASPLPASISPRRAASSRGTAPAFDSALCTRATDAASTPGAARIATFRPRMLPSPGRCVSDSAGDFVTSGRAGSITRGIGRGSGMPSPSATARASSSDTLRSIDTVRSRIAGTCTFVSSKRKPRTMCAFSHGVWLFQNSVACE